MTLCPTDYSSKVVFVLDIDAGNRVTMLLGKYYFFVSHVMLLANSFMPNCVIAIQYRKSELPKVPV